MRLDDEASLQLVPLLGDVGIDRLPPLRGGQFRLDLVEPDQEVLGRLWMREDTSG